MFLRNFPKNLLKYVAFPRRLCYTKIDIRIRCHEWQAVIAARAVENSGCPYCTGRRVLAGFNDLAALHPEIAAQWDDTLNGTLTPEMVTPGSHKRVWWKCHEGHVWKTAIYSRTGKQKCGCPVCAGKTTRQFRYEQR